MTVEVSVVVPTRNRPDSLNRCLRALEEQSLESHRYEVLVVQDGAPESPLAVPAPSLGEISTLCIRFLHTDAHQGPAAARNLGWRSARGTVIAFTDDDCVPDCDWLARGLAAFGPQVSGVTGRIVVPLPEIPTDYQRNVAQLESGEFATANCFYRKSVLEQAGGFDERFRIAWREDSDLLFTLMERGSHLLREPNAIVRHPPRQAPWGVSILEQRKSMYNALLYQKHPCLYRERVQKSPPWRYYAICLSLFWTIVAAIAGRLRARTLSSSVWLLLTGQFLAKRLRGTSRSPSHLAEMALTSAVIPPLAVFWRLRGAVKFRALFL